VPIRPDPFHLAAEIGERLAFLVIAGDADRLEAVGEPSQSL
jgi:hypothetical protein